MTPVTATLTINRITTENGYSTINMGQTEIIQDTKTILHVINTQEIRLTINAIERNIQNLQLNNDPIIRKQIETLKAKLITMEPQKSVRHRRGLINVIGQASKFLFGTMDDEDRKDITEHLSLVETNNENVVNTVNRQIEINQKFNESISHLKSVIESDRTELTRAFTELTENEKRYMLKQIRLDQILRLNTLEDKINQIIDNVALAKHGLIHPSLLTATEIIDTKIDFLKLKNIKVGALKYNTNTLVLAIKIPNSYKQVDLKFITPIPNKFNLEALLEEYFFIEINNAMYHYLNDVQYEKDLIPVNNCITNKNCTLKENYITEIKKLDESTIICKNMKNENIVNKCDDRNIKLEGNYLITINNCTIHMFNETISNKNMYFTERFYYDETQNYNFTKELNFEEVILKNIVNLKPIKLLRFHKNVQYVIGSTTVILSLTLIIIFFNLLRKHKKLIISIKNIKENNKSKIEEESKEIAKIQENFNLKEGEVTYPIAAHVRYPSLSTLNS